jgi:hypothetical protein
MREGKRLVGRPRRMWINNIKMDFGEIGYGGTDWLAVAQDMNKCRALVKGVLNLRVL